MGDLLTCKCGCNRTFPPHQGRGRKRYFYDKACANRYRRGRIYRGDNQKFISGKISQEDKDRMVNLYIEGYYSTEIAEKFGVTKESVSYHLKELIPAIYRRYERENKGARHNRLMTPVVLRLAKEARLNNYEISDYTNIPEASVRRILRNHNIPTAITNRKLWAKDKLDEEIPHPTKYKDLFERLERLEIGDNFRVDCKDLRDCRIHQASLYRYSVKRGNPRGWVVKTIKSKTNTFVRVYKLEVTHDD